MAIVHVYATTLYPRPCFLRRPTDVGAIRSRFSEPRQIGGRRPQLLSVRRPVGQSYRPRAHRGIPGFHRTGHGLVTSTPRPAAAALSSRTPTNRRAASRDCANTSSTRCGPPWKPRSKREIAKTGRSSFSTSISKTCGPNCCTPSGTLWANTRPGSPPHPRAPIRTNSRRSIASRSWWSPRIPTSRRRSSSTMFRWAGTCACSAPLTL